jgi:hypothetical protein
MDESVSPVSRRDTHVVDRRSVRALFDEQSDRGDGAFGAEIELDPARRVGAGIPGRPLIAIDRELWPSVAVLARGPKLDLARS